MRNWIFAALSRLITPRAVGFHLTLNQKRALLAAAFFCVGLSRAAAEPSQGVVVAATGTDCSDYFAVKTDDGYALLEWYSGYTPEKGDRVRGEFGQFGFRDISLSPGGASIHVWVEDYGLSMDDANDKLKSKCQ